jgi:hypothetical protein
MADGEVLGYYISEIRMSSIIMLCRNIKTIDPIETITQENPLFWAIIQALDQG